MARAKKDSTGKLIENIIEGIRKKKGKSVVSMNLTGLPNAVCRYFIISSGDSKAQVSAIADSVEETVYRSTREYPHHREGEQNAHWILIDYVDVVVHVFQPGYREFYNLESLWADGIVEHLPDEI